VAKSEGKHKKTMSKGVFMAVYKCGYCGTKQIPCKSRKYIDALLAIAQGTPCKACGRMCTLPMTFQTAVKYGIENSPYIRVKDHPGHWSKRVGKKR